ncbi:MAG: hypothetical protein J07HQX50_00658 [Haloquadratum sp. J07HQX50]|jgi:hypothetical protein|nr:MAG: hypothetical protein J07HQX50_00658 [Haloquadratum sp. J07HQX50]
MSNRIEELEAQVSDLQAAVNGLTEELVETKERVRLLERHVDVDLTGGDRSVGNRNSSDNDQTESASSEQPHQTAAHTDSDGYKSDEDRPTDDDASSESESDSESDIIIA